MSGDKGNVGNMKKLSGVLLVVILWYALSFMIGIDLVPLPHNVIYTFFKTFNSGLNIHVFASLKRLMLGLIIAIILGVHIGMILGLSKLSDKLFTPFINALYPIPKAALLPILIVIFGLGDLTKIILIIIIIIFPIIINIKNAITLIPKENFFVAYSLGLNLRNLYFHVILPAIMPSLLTSIRIGIGTSIAVLYLSESFVTFKGLGYYINLYIAVDNLRMFVAIFALSLIGMILFFIVDIIEKKLCRWL